MNVTYRCTDCGGTTRSEVRPEVELLECLHCNGKIRMAVSSAEDLGRRCVVCPSTELFVRKDFSQRLGVTIIVLGFVASSIAWAYHQSVLSLAILVGTALLDAGLYLVTGNVLTCYRCHSEYRDVPTLEGQPAFNLEVHERYRQQAARLAAAENSSTPLIKRDERAGAS